MFQRVPVSGDAIPKTAATLAYERDFAPLVGTDGGFTDEAGAFSIAVPPDETVNLVVDGSRRSEDLRGPFTITLFKGADVETALQFVNYR